MKNQTDEWELLDFTDAEAKVIHALLEKGAQSVSALARRAGLPRSTADSILRRLHERRIVRRVSKGYASVWRLVRPEKLKSEFERTADAFGIGDAKERIEKEIGVKVSENTEVHVYRGIDIVLEVYWHLLDSVHREERIYAIETAEAVRDFRQCVEPQKAIAFTRFISSRKIIIEAVFPESITDAYREFARENPKWAETFVPRMQATRVVPDALLPGTMELIIYGNRVTIVNYKEELLVLIQNEEMVLLFKALYRLMYEAGRSFDQNEFVRSLIAGQ